MTALKKSILSNLRGVAKTQNGKRNGMKTGKLYVMLFFYVCFNHAENNILI